MTNPYQPLKVYVAARWDDRDHALLMKKEIESRGLICTSTWLTPHDDQSMDALKAKSDAVNQARQRAIKDYQDIDASDCLLVYSNRKGFRNGTGGKHCEVGYAHGKGKPVFLLGERENIFHYHPLSKVIAGLSDFYRAYEVPEPNRVEYTDHDES